MTSVDLWDGEASEYRDVLLVKEEHEAVFAQYISEGMLATPPRRVFRLVPNAYGHEVLVGTYAALQFLGAPLRDVQALPQNQCPHETFLDGWQLLITTLSYSDPRGYRVAREWVNEWCPDLLKGARWLFDLMDGYCFTIVEPLLYGSPNMLLSPTTWSKRWWADRPLILQSIDALLKEISSKGGAARVVEPITQKLLGMRRHFSHFSGPAAAHTGSGTAMSHTRRLRVAAAYCAAIARALCRIECSALALQLSHRSADLYVLALAIESNVYDPRSGRYFADITGKEQESLSSTLHYLTQASVLASNSVRDDCFNLLNRVRNMLFCTHGFYGVTPNEATTLCSNSTSYVACLDGFGGNWIRLVDDLDPGVALAESCVFSADPAFASYLIDLSPEYLKQ